LLLYVLGILSAALIGVWVGLAFFALVAALWVVPDRRAERYLREHESHD
jgi:tetrahydromethanopterin S-methyltransferase subunit B